MQDSVPPASTVSASLARMLAKAPPIAFAPAAHAVEGACRGPLKPCRAAMWAPGDCTAILARVWGDT